MSFCSASGLSFNGVHWSLVKVLSYLVQDATVIRGSLLSTRLPRCGGCNSFMPFNVEGYNPMPLKLNCKKPK